MFKLTKQINRVLLSLTVVGIICCSQAARAENILPLPDIEVYPGQTGEMDMTLKNDDLVSAAQISFTYDSRLGFEIIGVDLTPRATGFEAPDGEINATNPARVDVRIVLYSLHGAAILPGDGAILTLRYQTSFEPGVLETRDLVFMPEHTVLSSLTFHPLSRTLQNGQIITFTQQSASLRLSGHDVPPGVPEPATLGIWLCGLLLFGIFRKYSAKG